MPIGKAVRATKPSTQAIAQADPEVVDNVIFSVTVARGFTISMGEYNSLKVQATVSASDYDTANAEVERVLALEVEKAGIQFNTIVGSEPGDDDTGEEVEGAEDAADADEGDEEAGITVEDIEAMKRPELVALITENALDIDPDAHPKNAKGLAALKAAIIATMSEDDDEAEPDADDAAEDADDEITEEAINAMERPALVAFIKANDIAVDPSKHTKLTALKTAVITVLSEATEDDADGEADADDTDGAEDEAASYDEDALKAMGLADLKAIYADWDMGKFPAGPPVKAKSLAIKAILAAQVEA